MAISNEVRRAGPFIGNGTQKEFPFAFVVLQPSDVAVYLFDGVSGSKADSSTFNVTLNDNQDNNPGGLVTLYSPLPVGRNLSIISEMPFTQPMVLTNRGGFYPEIINTSADRTTIMCQQLKEEVDRSLKVPVASEETPEELGERLLSAQDDARKYADQAQKSVETAVAIEERLLGQEATLGDALETLAEEKKEELVGVGDSQVARLQAITDETLVGYGVGGHQETWTLTEDVDSEGSIVLPNSMTYIRGRNHLRINWNGLTLYPSENFEEVGTVDQPSTTFKTLFQMKAGDVLNAWTVPLGRGELGTVETDVANLTSAVAELSRKAAFHNAGETQQ